MITVAIPAYNGSLFIEDAVKSVFNQSLGVDEIIIVDDCSSDITVEKTKEIIENNPNRNIRLVVNKKNIGYQANWNKCIELCKSRYLVILHQDDMLKCESCRKLLGFLTEHPELALAGGGEEMCDVSGMPLRQNQSVKPDNVYDKGRIYEFITETSSYIPCSSVMFDIEKIRHLGGFETGVSATDELYWPKVLTMYPIAILGDTLILRRCHTNQAEYVSFVADEKQALFFYQKFRDLAQLETRSENRKKIISFVRKKFFLGYIGIISVSLARRGYLRLSVKYFIKAFKINPAGFFLLPSLWKTILKIKYFIFLEWMKRIKKYFTEMSGSFTRYLIRKYFLNKLESSLSDCTKVLELGAGKFSYLRSLKKKFHITAFDIDQKSLDIAKGDNVYDQYVRGDVTKISDHFSENSFDCVVAFDLIEHLEKEDGLVLIKNMEKIAKKRIVIYTPNGFLFQDVIDGNIYQKHISGWSYHEMKVNSFRVYGINGLKVFRGPLALPRIRPGFIGYFLSNLSWIMLKVLGLDKFAFSILCIKDIK